VHRRRDPNTDRRRSTPGSYAVCGAWTSLPERVVPAILALVGSDGDEPAGRARWKKKRGRKGAKRRAVARPGLTPEEKSAFVFKHRHLFLKRRGNLTESEHDLRRML